MPKPQVSVVMVVQDDQENLNPSLDSVLRQTIEDFELIVIDNGSTDNSSSIIEACTDKRVKYHHIQKTTTYTALLKGLELAKADYIAFMGATDAIYPHRLKTQLDYLSAHTSAQVVTSDFLIMDKDNLPKAVQNNMSRPNQLRLQILLDIPIPLNTLMLKKAAIKPIKKLLAKKIDNERLLLWLLSTECVLANVGELLYAKRKLTIDKPAYSSRKIEKQIWSKAKPLLKRSVIRAELATYASQDLEIVKPYLALLTSTFKAAGVHGKRILSYNMLISMMSVKGFRHLIKEFLLDSAMRKQYNPTAHTAMEEDFIL